MKNVLTLWLILVVSGFFGLAGCSVAQLKYSFVTIEITKLSDNLYMLTGAGGNIGVSVGEDGVLVVDTQHAPLSERIFAAIRKLSSKPVRYVVNTHWHHDHTGGNENFGKAGAVIVAHENLRMRLMSEQTLKDWNLTFPAMPAAALPGVTYADKWSIRFNGEDVQLKHPPRAHTDGDSIVFFPKANVIHMGDILATGRFPYIDRGARGSVKGVIAAFEYAVSIADDKTKVIPGHGDPTDRHGLVAYLDMLRRSRAAVLPLMQAGKSRAEVIAARPLEELGKVWGRDFVTADLFTEIVVDTENAR